MGYYLYPENERVHNVGGSDELPLDLENERRILWTISSSPESFNRWRLYKKSGQFDLVDAIYDHEAELGFSLGELRTRKVKGGSDGSYATMLLSLKKIMGLLAASVEEKNTGGTLRHLVYVWAFPTETFSCDLSSKRVMEWLGQQEPERLPASDSTEGKYGEKEFGYYVPKRLCQTYKNKKENPWKGDDNCWFDTWKDNITEPDPF